MRIRGRKFSQTACYGKAAAGGGYVGPGDVQSGALAAFCLRAYNAAGIGGNVIDIKRASDSTTQTFVSLASGALDVASITTFLTATTGTVTKWWDQSGNGHHATATVAPAFTLSVSGLGAGKPGITFDGATASQLMTITAFSAPQAFFISDVSIRTSGTGYTGILCAAGSNAPGLLYNNTTNKILLFGGNTTSVATVSDGAFHALGALFNGVSSQAYVDGTGQGAISAGAGNFGAFNFQIGNFSGTPLAGSISEILLYGSDVSASAAALSTNQHGSANGYNF